MNWFSILWKQIHKNSIFKANTEGLHEKAERLISNLFLHLSERKKGTQVSFVT